jgi:hypothetical protein
VKDVELNSHLFNGNIYYHGTNRAGICGIINDGFFGTMYFDGYGVF